jgi:succinyl-CoA synthetase alpha subunit
LRQFLTEGIPVRDMIEIKDRMRRENRKTLLLGPNSPGTITPDELKKIGIMRATSTGKAASAWCRIRVR